MKQLSTPRKAETLCASGEDNLPVGFVTSADGIAMGDEGDDDGMSDSGSGDEDVPVITHALTVPAPNAEAQLSISETELNTKLTDGVRMDTDTFLVMIHEFGFYPKIVQVHSVRQHLEMSLNRRKAKKLTYEAFIECLLRISFVYLSMYGNNVQQAAGSKAKCIWLLTLLRSRYKHLGLSKRGSAMGRGEVDLSGEWVRKTVNVDTMPLKSLVLWPALDAQVGPQRPKINIDPSTARASFNAGFSTYPSALPCTRE